MQPSPVASALLMDGTRTSDSELYVSRRWSRMKSLLVIGLFLDLVGVVIVGMGEVMKGAASLRSLQESYKDSFDYDVQQRPWSARLLLVLGAKRVPAQRG